MRVIHAPQSPAGLAMPIPAAPARCESIAVTWCREIATSVAAALDVNVVEASYRLTLHPDLPAPHTLHTVFTVAGHQVAVTVLWDDLWCEPGFALTIDGQPVAFDTSSPARPAVVLAHAAWRAIADIDRQARARAAG